MPAVDWDLAVQVGAPEPEYVTVRDPASTTTPKAPVDLTGSGYQVRGVVATRSDGRGRVLAEWADGVVLHRSVDGRVTFRPPAALTTAWAAVWRSGWHQIELTHPDLPPARLAQGRVRLLPELVT